jgi:hypothetical protein
LAIRTLLQLVSDKERRFLRSALELREYIYVGDVLAGGDTLENALKVGTGGTIAPDWRISVKQMGRIARDFLSK